MAKTNVTTHVIPKDGIDFSIHVVKAGLQCVVDDTTIDANTEMIIVPENAAFNPVVFTKTLTVTGNADIPPTFILNYKKGTQQHVGGIIFQGKVTLSDIDIESAGILDFTSASLFTFNNVSLQLTPNLLNDGTLIRLVHKQASLSVKGLIIQGGGNAFQFAKILNLEGYSPRDMKESLLMDESTTWIVLKGMNPRLTTGGSHLTFFVRTRYDAIGFPDAAPKVTYHYNWPAGNMESMAAIRKPVKLSVFNRNTNALVNAEMDFYGGLHQPTLYPEDMWVNLDGIKINAPIQYKKTVVNGIIEFTATLAFIGRKANYHSGLNSSPFPVLYLSHATDHNYSLTIPVKIYGFKVSFITVKPVGVSILLEQNVYLEPYKAITNASQTLVDAYTTLEKNAKLLDSWHSFYVKNLTFKDGKPNYENIIVDNGLDLSAIKDWTLAIDKNATKVRDVNTVTQTLTIKASTYTGTVKTTGAGTIILKNGAILTGGTYNKVVLESGFSGSLTLANVKITTLENKTGNDIQLAFAGTSVAPTTLIETSGKLSYTDSTGTILLPTGADIVTLHLTRADADTGVNPISTGTSFSYRASAYANKIIFLRATSTSNPSLELISSTQVPALAGSHSFSSLQFGESKQLSSIIKMLVKIGKEITHALSEIVKANKKLK